MSASRVNLLLRVDMLGLVEGSLHLVAVDGVAIVVSVHDGGGLGWLHHRQDLGETLTILIIENKNRRRYILDGLIRQIK